MDVGRETGRKENSEDLGRKPIGKKRNQKKREKVIIRNHQLSLPMAKAERNGQCKQDAGRCCPALLAAMLGADLSFQCWDLCDNSFLLAFGSLQKRGPAAVPISCQSTPQSICAFFSQLTFSILLLFKILHCFRSLSPPKIKCST